MELSLPFVLRALLTGKNCMKYPFCSCPDSKFMKIRANRKQKWMPCKHLYFVLQQHFSCTEEDVFIHCPRWTPNEVKLLLERATWLK